MIDELPAAPDPAVDPPAVFSAKAAAFVLAQKAMVGQINATLAALSAFAAGGAFAIPYVFDAAIGDADPGPGKLRLNSAAQNAATAAYLDLQNAAGQDVTGLLDQMDASTSIVKGKLRLVKVSDTSQWVTFDVSARWTATGYRALTLANPVGGSAAMFASGDMLVMHFQRTGDKGEPGAFGTMIVRDQKAANQNGQSMAAGVWATRDLNTTLANTISGASLSGNAFTLPAGKYWIDASAPAFATNGHQVRLYNVTDGAVAETGTLEYAQFSSPTTACTRSFLRAVIEIASSKTYRIEHYAENVSNGGLGRTGLVSLFTEVKITKAT